MFGRRGSHVWPIELACLVDGVPMVDRDCMFGR